jgi:hypothetical protein
LAEEVRSISDAVSAAEQSQRKERDSVGRDVSRLSRACEDIGAKSDRLTRLFETEQLYRWGCETLYGTNGYDERGQEKSFRLGLLQLKTAATSVTATRSTFTAAASASWRRA